MLLTTALVATGSLYSADSRADSPEMAGQPGVLLNSMGLSRAGSLNLALKLPGSKDATYWRLAGNGYGYGRQYARGNSYRYGSNRGYRRDYSYYGESYYGAPNPVEPGPGDFETEEFNNSNALSAINAQAAYAAGADGSSVLVGVIDEDFDLDHPELAPNIIDFVDVTGGNRFGLPDLNEEEQREANELESRLDALLATGHGTEVAGVIAAARNGQGIHGVAPEAGILAIRADSFELNPIADADDANSAIEEGITTFVLGDETSSDAAEIVTLSDDDEESDAQIDRISDALADENISVLAVEGGGVFDDANIAEALNVASARGVDIINLSLGGAGQNSDELTDAVIRATDQGRIVLFAGGNEDRSDETSLNVDDSALIAGDPRTNGLVIAVGAVDQDNEILFNNCGTVAEQCLVALGEDVQTTQNGGGIGPEDGSSFTTPAVSGSLALLLDLFPTLSSEEAVQLLFTTATDLGAEGVDEVFGNGLVNLERAVQPVGVASLPTTRSIRGKVVSLNSSRLGVGGAFGNAFGRSRVFQQGFFLDEFRRPFKADLSQQVVAEYRGINFDGVLGSSDIETETFVNPNGVQVSLSLKNDRRDDAFETPLAAVGSAQEAFDRDNQLQTLRLSGEVTPGLTMSSGFNLTAGQQLTADPVSKTTNGLFLFEGDAVNPQHGFLGKGNGLSLTHDLSEATSFTVGFLTAGDQIGDRGGEGTTTQADLNHRFENGAALGFTASFTQESEGFLGSEAGGAFAESSKTSSQFYTLSGSLPMVTDVEMFGSATVGLSDLSGVNGGLLSDLDRTTSSAFALGVVKKGVVDDKDRLGLRFSQPLRIEGGADATLTVPTAVNADGSIITASDTVSLQPTGRELNLQLAYTRQLAETLNVTNYALARSEPGHNADAKADFGVGVRMNWNF